MIVGFNHNVVYQGASYHVQTEDGGLSNPRVTTQLYREGAVVASRKTSYADILKADSLERIVEDLMKEQHKDMLRALKNGEFDAAIQRRFGTSATLSAATPVADEAGNAAAADLDALVYAYLSGDTPS